MTSDYLNLPRRSESTARAQREGSNVVSADIRRAPLRAGTLRGMTGDDGTLILNVWRIFDQRGIAIGKSYEPYIGKGARFHAARDSKDEYERQTYEMTIELLPNGMWRDIDV